MRTSLSGCATKLERTRVGIGLAPLTRMQINHYANRETMYRVYRVAAEFKPPVLLHSNITSKLERNPLYFGEFKDALTSHPM